MAKGDDALVRKRSRARRKKMRSEESSSSSVSARVAAIIASKRRRKSGKRRICEGMCFTLPTPEDPFNDRNDPRQEKKKATDNRNSFESQKVNISSKIDNQIETEKHKVLMKNISVDGMDHAKKRNLGDGSSEDCPSKFAVLCLSAIQNALPQDFSFNLCSAKALLGSRWGIDFWRHCSAGFDIVDICGAAASIEQIAWMVSTASDIIARKEKGGTFIRTPFFLYIVSSQDRAAKVRAVCKPLKNLGVHTVSLHPGATIDHQVQGLRMCEPEFVISTPERLLELVTLGTVDISAVSILVFDDLRSLVSLESVDNIKSIRSFIVGSLQTIVFSKPLRAEDGSTDILSTLMRPPVCKLSSDGIV